jgi:hypothetical protein
MKCGVSSAFNTVAVHNEVSGERAINWIVIPLLRCEVIFGVPRRVEEKLLNGI